MTYEEWLKQKEAQARSGSSTAKAKPSGYDEWKASKAGPSTTIKPAGYESSNPVRPQYIYPGFNSELKRKADPGFTTRNRWYRYHDKSYAELSSMLTEMEEGEEKDWLSAYASSVDYNEKSRFDIAAGTREIAQLESVLKEYQDLTRWMTDEAGEARAEAIRQQYGGQDEIQALIQQKKQYLSQSRRLQDSIALAGVADPESEHFDPDFADYSGYVSTQSAAGLGKLASQYGMGYEDLTYEYLNNQDGVRDEIKSRFRGINRSNDESPFEKKGYDYITDDQLAIYNYYYAKDGREAAEKYLDSIQESLSYQKATSLFQGIEDKTVLELAFGVAAGLDQFEGGLKGLGQAISGKDDYIPMSAYQMASGMVREDLGDVGVKLPDWMGGASLGQLGYDATTTTANMAPSIMTSMALGAINPVAGSAAGTALMGASAGGNAYQEMLNLGYDKDQARTYAALVGSSEAGLQYLLGGIGSLGGKLSGNAIGKIMNGVDNAFARVAINLTGNAVSEGVEEGLQEILTPWFQNLVLHADEDINWSEVAYSSLLGALTAGFMEGGSTISGEVNTYQTGRQLQEGGISAQRLADIGSTFSADTVAYQLAGRVDENTGAYTIGRLFNEIGAELTEQNKADIAESLVNKGMSADHARLYAEVMAYIMDGGQLSDVQMKMIESNDVLAKTMQEVIIDPNSTVNQRIKGFNEAHAALTGEVPEVAAPATAQPAQAETVTPTENTAPTSVEVPAESRYESSAEGKTILKSTGETVGIKEIASIKDGKMTLKLDDGRTVDASDVSYSSQDEALVYEAVADMGTNAVAADMLVKAFTPGGISAQAYAHGIKEAYTYGQYNYPVREVANGPFSSMLTEYQRQTAYKLGQIFSGKQVAKEQAAVRNNRTVAKNATTVSRKETVGKVHFDGDRSKLTKRQKVSISAMETVADALGVQIYVFESPVGKDGKRIGSNGWYGLEDGSIHIDLYAGVNGEATMLFTLAHELTHFIRQWSPAKFKVLANFLMEEYGKKGVSVEALVEKQIHKAKENKRTISRDEAYEEVIADSMEAMLTDGNVVEKLAKLKQRDKSLWQKIKDYITDMAAKIRKAYAGLVPDSQEGRYVARMKDAIERLQDLFTDALVDASENRQTTPKAEKNTTQEGGAKFQTRNVNGDQVVWIEANILKENKGLPVHQFVANYIAEHIGEVYTIIESGQKVYIGQDLPGEYTQSKYTKAILRNNPNIARAKNRASANLGEMIEIATNRRWEKTKHHGSKDAKYGMYRYDTRFGFPVKDTSGRVTGANIFRAELLIRNASDGKKYLYDIVSIKKDTASSDWLTQRVTSAAGKTAGQKGVVFKDNVAQKTTEVNKKFSMREPVERTKNLVALHNLTEDKLVKALELGGFPMPSIAITKADIPHTNFGDITLVFGSEVIDPKKSRKNVVYSADAWTPTFPRIEYEADDKVASKVHSRLSGLSKQVDDYFRRDLGRVTYDMEDILNRYDGEEGLIQYALDNYGLKAAYLEERGEHIQPETRQEEVTLGVSPEMEDKYLRILEVLDIYTPEQVSGLILKDVRDKHGKELEEIYPGVTKSALRLGRVLNRIRAYLSGVGMGTEYKTVTDAAATNAAVDSKLDMGEYEAWVRELFRNIEKSRGVHNNKDRFTPSGNRRSFKQTHLPATLENIVKAMATQNGGSTKNVSGFNGIKTLRAGTAKRFRSIAEMHNYEGRLQNLTEEQLSEIQDQLGARLYDIIKAIDEEGTQLGGSNSLIRYDSIGETLMEIAEGGRYNIADIQNRFAMYSKEISDELAAQVKELLFDVTQMPVNLFEAKPERAVLFDEIRAAILPKTTSKEVVDGLRNHGVPVQMYESGDNATRLDLVNSLEGVRFSERDPEQQRVNRVLEKENAKLREDVTYLKELLRLQRSVTGGKKFTKTSVEAAATSLMKYASARGTKAELVSLLNGFYEYIAAGEELTWEGVVEQAQPVVQWLQANEHAKKQTNEYAADILRELRGTRISLDDLQKKEVAYQYGSFNEFRKKAMGSIIVTNTGTPLDVQWIELSRLYPNIFNPETTSNDMPAALLDAISTLRNMPPESEFSYDREMAAQDLLHQVYDSYWSVSTRYTVADVKQREINRLKSAHHQRMTDLRETHRENTAKLKQQHSADLKRVREEMRAAADAKQQKIVQKYQESRQRGIESRNKTAMRHKIQRVVTDLNQYLLNGTKDRHVPIGLQKAVAEALDAVNMDTVGADERLAKLQAEMVRAKTPQQVAEIAKKFDHVREMDDRMQARLKALHDAYDEIRNDEDPLMSNVYDDGLSAHMMTLIVEVGDTPLRDMTMHQLGCVYDVYQIVLTTVRNANKAFKAAKNESIASLGNMAMLEVSGIGGKKQYSMKGMEGIKSFGWNNLKPVYAFEHIGSKTLIELFNNVRAGEDTWALDVTEAREYYLDKSKKFKYNSWDFAKRHTFKSTSGMDFSLNLEQIMSLYAYSKRDQAADHLRRGGIVIDETTEVTMKTKLGIPVKFNPTEATAYNISDMTLAEIVGTLTPEQKGFVDEMQDYLSTVMGGKGNEVSLAMYGIKLFKEKFYFPLKSAPQFMAKAKEQQQGEVKIKNSGFSKQTVKKASNPIVLTPFMNVWADHVNEMSMYHAFVLPMEDFYRVYNFKTPTSEGTATQSVEMTIQNAYGKGATKYIDQLLKDLNGGARTDSTTGIINKMIGLFKKGAVFASLSVVVQQPSAIARAAALIDTKYFIGPKVDQKKHKALWEEVKQYAPVAIIKEMGYFDTNMGKSTQDFIMGQEYSGFSEKMKAVVADSNYRDEILSKAPALADELAWCSIWEAVKRETMEKNPGMKANSEEFLQKAGKRFTEVITKTQVYDSVLSRSALMRSKDTGMKMATAFMAEPTTSINMIADALLKGKRGNRKYARGAIGAVIASQILNSILVSFVYAGRDDDEDETYLEKYLGTLTGELLDSLNPATYIPFIKDIISIVQGFDVERSDMAVVSDLWNAWQKLGSDKLSPYRKVEGFVGSVAQLFGLPVKNVMRDARGIYQTIASFMSGQKTTKAGIGYAVQSAVTGQTVSNQQQLYEAYLSGDKNQISRVEGRFKNQSAINTAIRAALRENDSRIRVAAEARVNGNLTEYTRLAKEIIAEGHFSQDNVIAAINAEINAMSKSDSTSTPKALGLYKSEDFATAISGGDSAMASAVRDDIIQTAQKNGKTADEAKKSFISSAKSSMKELFLAKGITETQAVNALVAYCGETGEEARKRVAEWAFEEEYGFTYGEKIQKFKDGTISAAELKGVLIDVDGKTADEAASAIVSYSREGYEEGNFSRSETAELMMEYGGLTRTEAEAKLRYIDFKIANPDVYADDAWIDEYYEEVQSSGISINVFVEYRNTVKSMTGTNKKVQRMAVINSLPISSDQKDALYYAEGWAASRLYEAPWH